MSEGLLKKLVQEAIQHKNTDLFYELWYDPYYWLMYLCAKNTKGICVELGVHNGRGSYSMLKAGSAVVGIDVADHPNLDMLQSEYDKFTFYKQSTVPAVQLEENSVGVLHIDTEHSYSQAQNEFEAYKPYLKDGAVVMFDDTHAMEDGVLKYFNSLPYFKIVDDRLHSPCGYGVLIYKKDIQYKNTKDARHFRQVG